MGETSIKKNIVHDLTAMVDYKIGCMVAKTLINKASGNIRVLALDDGEMLMERISPFDRFIYVMEGAGQVVINEETHRIKAGECIILPAHNRTTIKAIERLKLMITIIKSGYESVII